MSEEGSEGMVFGDIPPPNLEIGVVVLAKLFGLLSD